MIPRLFKRMLTGRAGDTLAPPRRPPIRFLPDPAIVTAAKDDPRVRHDLTAGYFEVIDETPAPTTTVTVETVDQAAAAQLAAELKATLTPDADPDRSAAPSTSSRRA